MAETVFLRKRGRKGSLGRERHPRVSSVLRGLSAVAAVSEKNPRFLLMSRDRGRDAPLKQKQELGVTCRSRHLGRDLNEPGWKISNGTEPRGTTQH